MDEINLRFPKEDNLVVNSIYVEGRFSHNELKNSSGEIIWSNKPFQYITWMGIIEKVEKSEFYVRYIDEYGNNDRASINGDLHGWCKIFEQTEEYNIGDLFVCLSSGYKLFISPEHHWRFYNKK